MIIKKITDFLFPQRCIFCNSCITYNNNNKSKLKIDLCENCKNELPILKNHCLLCGYPLSSGQTLCGNCIKYNNQKLTINTIIPFHYAPPIDKLIIGLKFNNILINANILGALLAECLQKYYKNHPKPTVIIPAPLYPKRLSERGYNQALELSYEIKKTLKIPIDKSSLVRIKNTTAQSLLPAKKRTQNIKHAFQLTKKLNHAHIAIIDDVMTTGATINEICKTLTESGVSEIDIWCCAKSTLNV